MNVTYVQGLFMASAYAMMQEPTGQFSMSRPLFYTLGANRRPRYCCGLIGLPCLPLNSDRSIHIRYPPYEHKTMHMI
jgi:hypothetical protein